MLYAISVVFIWGLTLSIIVLFLYKKMWKGVSIFCLFVILILNLFPTMPVYLWIEPLMQSYHYTTADGLFTFREVTGKEKDLATMRKQFEAYQEGNPNFRQDTTIYRTFKMKPLKFWKWGEYLTHQRWDYPYKEPDSVPHN